MRSLNFEAPQVVTGVYRHGTPFVLVEDTWAMDSESSTPENRRTWIGDSGEEVKTMTSPAAAGSARALDSIVPDALSGAVMERLMIDAVPREPLTASLQRARAAQTQEDQRCLVIDGEPRVGLSASADGTYVRGAITRETVVLTISGAQPVSLALRQFDTRSPLAQQ